LNNIPFSVDLFKKILKKYDFLLENFGDIRKSYIFAMFSWY